MTELGRGTSCFCGQPDDRERVHRAHECVPWVSREAGRTHSSDARCFDPFCAEHSRLMNAPVQFWSCPVDEHRDRRGVVTVEWREGVAYCTAPDCERTSRG